MGRPHPEGHEGLGLVALHPLSLLKLLVVFVPALPHVVTPGLHDLGVESVFDDGVAVEEKVLPRLFPGEGRLQKGSLVHDGFQGRFDPIGLPFGLFVVIGRRPGDYRFVGKLMIDGVVDYRA